VTVDPSGNLAMTFLDNTLQFAKVVRGQLPTVAEFDLVPNQKIERDFDETTGLLSVDFKATQDLLIYASYATGFKSGGFNQRIPPPGVLEPINYEPETSATYELGWKWTNQASTLRINGSYYFTEYEDLQVNVFAGVAPTTLNAVEAEIQGYEIELLANPIEALSISANIAYIDAEYTKAPGAIPGARTINKNDKFPNTPEFTAFVGVDYTWALAAGELTLHTDWSYRDEVQNNTINSPQIEQDALNLFNAALIYRTGEHWQFAFSGRNLSDETYIITGNEELPGFGYAEAVYAKEREWALSAKYSF
jgi:iron complex outermembrane receptor protein